MVKPRIEADWKISKVLEEYPQLLDTLATSHPTFGKLRNPLIRKVQSKLVTVQQAAGVAGIDPTKFLNRLNAAVGHEAVAQTPPSTEKAAMGRPDWIDSAKIAHELDVRPMLERGEEPFRAINQAASRIAVGDVLSLRSPFDPVPLRDVLGKQGFEAHTSGAGDDWTTLFFRVREARAAKPVTVAATGAPVTAEVTIDVSELVPPEPMMKILAALAELPDGGQLTVHHVRRPMHLYPRLDELGYTHSTIELGPDKVQLVITKPAHPS
jgi:uncharacterized protein (DUF2249 family)